MTNKEIQKLLIPLQSIDQSKILDDKDNTKLDLAKFNNLPKVLKVKKILLKAGIAKKDLMAKGFVPFAMIIRL